MNIISKIVSGIVVQVKIKILKIESMENCVISRNVVLF